MTWSTIGVIAWLVVSAALIYIVMNRRTAALFMGGRSKGGGEAPKEGGTGPGEAGGDESHLYTALLEKNKKLQRDQTTAARWYRSREMGVEVHEDDERTSREERNGEMREVPAWEKAREEFPGRYAGVSGKARYKRDKNFWNERRGLRAVEELAEIKREIEKGEGLKKDLENSLRDIRLQIFLLSPGADIVDVDGVSLKELVKGVWGCIRKRGTATELEGEFLNKVPDFVKEEAREEHFKERVEKNVVVSGEKEAQIVMVKDIFRRSRRQGRGLTEDEVRFIASTYDGSITVANRELSEEIALIQSEQVARNLASDEAKKDANLKNKPKTIDEVLLEVEKRLDEPGVVAQSLERAKRTDYPNYWTDKDKARHVLRSEVISKWADEQQRVPTCKAGCHVPFNGGNIGFYCSVCGLLLSAHLDGPDIDGISVDLWRRLDKMTELRAEIRGRQKKRRDRAIQESFMRGVEEGRKNCPDCREKEKRTFGRDAEEAKPLMYPHVCWTCDKCGDAWEHQAYLSTCESFQEHSRLIHQCGVVTGGITYFEQKPDISEGFVKRVEFNDRRTDHFSSHSHTCLVCKHFYLMHDGVEETCEEKISQMIAKHRCSVNPKEQLAGDPDKFKSLTAEEQRKEEAATRRAVEVYYFGEKQGSKPSQVQEDEEMPPKPKENLVKRQLRHADIAYFSGMRVVYRNRHLDCGKIGKHNRSAQMSDGKVYCLVCGEILEDAKEEKSDARTEN